MKKTLFCTRMRIFNFLLIPTLFFCMQGCRSKKESEIPPIPVKAFLVEPQTIPAEFEFVGVAKSSHPVEIRSRVEGYLLSIDYTEGALVKENDLLFRIDPRQYENSLQEAIGELAKQEAILWRAKKSLERTYPLYQENAVSLRTLDDDIAQVLSAEASVITAKGNLKQAELNLSYTFIRSPVDGYAGKSRFYEGTLITPSVNGLLTYVSVIDPIWVYFSVSDSELLEGRAEGEAKKLILPKEKNYSVSLELADGTQYPYTGCVNFASPTLDPTTGTLTVRGTFPNPRGEILPGQFVKAKVSGAYRPDALFVPQTAVFQGRKGMYVFVIQPNNESVSTREVQLGAWYKNYWIVKGGLKAGEKVVADGVNRLQEESKIEVTRVLTPKPPPFQKEGMTCERNKKDL